MPASETVSDPRLDAPGLPPAEGPTIRAARAALVFAILGALLLVDFYLIPLPDMGGLLENYPLRITIGFIILSLAGVCGLRAILVGTRTLRLSHQVLPDSRRSQRLARTARTLGIVDLGLACLGALVIIVNQSLHM